MAKESSKEEVYKAVLNAAVELEIQLGHLKWTYTLLARRSKISRSLIYYYFGKSKINILKEATLLFGQELSGVVEERMRYWEEGQIENGLLKTRELFKNYPYLVPFYFLYRSKENEIGELIRKYENEGHKKRRMFFPNMDEAELKALYAFHLGLVTFPGLNREDVTSACHILNRYFK
tara:strand:+ start:20477 stop:21007 length:531 start_codon:yes stop_codon:yes gene_type:complete